MQSETALVADWLTDGVGIAGTQGRAEGGARAAGERRAGRVGGERQGKSFGVPWCGLVA
jgi:hypothetical protein